ncbi:MAG: hypothetical protein A3H95_06995 [Acidobacteria bacterium RIFCSPLOWO2_02_FULL_64_15]|nr:MAG: hypothetical protein A3H95_06995 [Acidobacteria bacterium RIFCSPLOWO2_02_FULL_64_15]
MAIDRAATLHNAEKLVRQGKLELAAAEYRRVVEEQPRDWNTANTLGDLYVRIGQTDKAVEQLTRVADQLSTEGFLPKASALYKKILKLKPDDERTLLQMAEIAANQGLLADARAYLTTVLDRRLSRRDKRGAAEVRIRLGLLDPSDVDGRLMAARTRAEIGDVAGAVRDLKAIATELVSKGREAEAFKLLREALSLDPKDRDLRAHLARGAVARGDLATAAEFLTAEIAGDDPDLLLVMAGIRLRGDAPDEAIGIVSRLLERHPERREQIRRLGVAVAEQAPEPSYGVIRLVIESMIAAGDLASAAAALQEFVNRVPHHIPALRRLVEVSVDAGIESVMYSAQAQLADAYLTAGLAAEALFIAEDLMAREPWDSENVERLRRALELAGEPDPVGLIAERLSGRSPFMATDLSGDPGDVPPFEAQMPEADARTRVNTAAPVEEKAETKPAVKEGIAHAEAETVEVDLSMLDASEPSSPAPSDPPPEAAPAPDLEGVFERLRGEAARRSAVEAAEERYKHALELWAAGDLDGAVAALQEASRVPKLRFPAAALLGRIFRDRGMVAEAVEWFERAAEAPATSPDELHELLYDFADALETEGEIARALAVTLELQAEAGAYRDVAARVDRLSKVQARG